MKQTRSALTARIGLQTAGTAKQVVPRRMLSRSAVLQLACGVGLWCGSQALSGCEAGASVPLIVQPMGFSHATHFEQDTACVDCHIRSAEGRYSTLPGIKACLLCHEEPQGEDPEEPRVREFAELGIEIPWVRVNRVEGHVYFSHAPHVALGKMGCVECHGDMTTVDQALTSSQIEGLTMRACMDCHDERQVSNDCLLCHQ